MSILNSFRISSSALTAQRLRMDVIANNIANAETTRGTDGKPYQRKSVVFTTAPSTPTGPMVRRLAMKQESNSGVQVASIVQDETATRAVYEPNHPDADADGYVTYPDIDIITEMTDMIAATRAYEASITAINAAKQMATKALEISRG